MNTRAPNNDINIIGIGNSTSGSIGVILVVVVNSSGS